MSTLVQIEAYIQTETEKAILVSEEREGTVFDEWLPKSQARVLETDKNGLSRIAIQEWLVVKKGLDALVMTEAEDERP